MIEERGRVVGVDSAGIWVETSKTSACAACAAKSGCGQKLLVQASGQKAFIFNVLNPSQLIVQVDDAVMVGVEEGSLLKATLVTYLIPLLTLMLFAVVAHQLSWPEGWVVTISLVGLVIGFGLVRAISQLLFRSSKFQPVLTKILVQ